MENSLFCIWSSWMPLDLKEILALHIRGCLGSVCKNWFVALYRTHVLRFLRSWLAGVSRDRAKLWSEIIALGNLPVLSLHWATLFPKKIPTFRHTGTGYMDAFQRVWRHCGRAGECGVRSYFYPIWRFFCTCEHYNVTLPIRSLENTRAGVVICITAVWVACRIYMVKRIWISR